MKRFLLFGMAIGLLWAPSVGEAQTVHILDEPGVEPEEEQAERRSQLRVAMLARADLGSRDASPGFEQLTVLRSEVPWATFGASLEYEYLAVEWLRVGAALGYEQSSIDSEDVRGFDYKIETAHVDLSITPTTTIADGSRFRVDAGLRISAGIGFSSWTLSDLSENGALLRVAGELDLAFLIGVAGVGFRFGYQFAQTTELGPAKLRFDLSGLQGNLGFIVRL